VVIIVHFSYLVSLNQSFNTWLLALTSNSSSNVLSEIFLLYLCRKDRNTGVLYRIHWYKIELSKCSYIQDTFFGILDTYLDTCNFRYYPALYPVVMLISSSSRCGCCDVVLTDRERERERESITRASSVLRQLSTAGDKTIPRLSLEKLQRRPTQ